MAAQNDAARAARWNAYWESLTPERQAEELRMMDAYAAGADTTARRQSFPFTTPEGSDASMFIQWKGTEVCLDFHCPCGAHCHLDSGFAHFVECPHCGSVFEMGTQVIAKRTASPAGTPRVMDPQEDLGTGGNR